MTEQLPIADVQSGFFEYRANFNEPIFAAWFSKDAPARGMYKLLTRWGIDLSKVSFNANPKNLQELQASFTTANPPVLINLGLGSVAFIVQNADWSQAPALLPMFQTVLDHLKTTIPVEISFQQTILGFHVKPGPKPFRDAMREFVNANALGTEEATMYGAAAYGPNYTVLMDKSLEITDGLFVKITRVFPVATAFEEMASILWRDEEGLLHRLGFRTQ